ncbi:TPA: SGNH/GDSL hydrolase family protein [Streptococcus suis]
MGIDNHLKVIKEGVFGRDVRQAIHDGIQQAYDDATANGNANMEVAKARGMYDTLPNRLQAIDELLISNLNSLTSIGPKDVVGSFDVLVGMYPSGSDGVYITADTGHWYFWNGVSWSDGGAYQAVEVLDNAVTPNKINTITPKQYNMLTLGPVTNPGNIASYDANKKVVVQTTGNTGLVKLDLTSDDVNIVGKLDTDIAIYWGKVIVITDSTDTYLRWESVADVEAVRSLFLSYDAQTKKFEIDIAVLKQSYPTASRIYLAYTPQFTPLIYRKLHLSQFDWLQPIETSEVKDGAITQSKIKIDEELVLPETIPCVVGHEMNCYWENALLYGRIDAVQKIDTERSLTTSERFRDRFIWKPTEAGSTTMKVMLWKKSLKQIDYSKVVSFKAVSATAGTGTKKVLVIGDSKVASGFVTNTIKELMTADTSMDIELLGTLYNWTTDNRHEGRGGWSAADYCTLATKGNKPNAFWDVDTSSFNFSKYMATQGYAGVDYVFINLGTNDVGTYTNAQILAYYQTMIDSIHIYDPSVNIVIGLTEGIYAGVSTNPSSDPKWDTQANLQSLRKDFIATFDKRESEKIYVCPLYLNMDLYEDYNTASVPLSSRDATKTRTIVTDPIHQSSVGFRKNADTMYYTLKYIESLG